MDNTKLKEDILWASSLLDQSIEEIQRVVFGQDKMIHGIFLGILASGNVLLEGMPGLAKTLTLKSLAKVMDLDFKRIQFTPDLLPADLTGTMIYRQQTGEFLVRKGPLFSNIILADEVNRAPAKVQSALLEAMEEGQVTIGENTYKLPNPFFVLATQNPIDQEGTYKLPEAQLDRFMLKLKVNFPEVEDEVEIVKNIDQIRQTEEHLKKIISLNDFIKIRDLIKDIKVDDKIVKYIVSINSLSRTKEVKYEFSPLIEHGASLRASIAMYRCAKANALLDGRDFVMPEDIKYIAHATLRHRIILSYEGESEDLDTDDVIKMILSHIKAP